MNEQPNRFAEVQQWVKIAESDFRTAELLMKIEEESPFEAICFHAQQCAEKYLKALLVFHSIDFPRTYDGFPEPQRREKTQWVAEFD